jgi:hypothetical protein
MHRCMHAAWVCLYCTYIQRSNPQTGELVDTAHVNQTPAIQTSISLPPICIKAGLVSQEEGTLASRVHPLFRSTSRELKYR